MRQRKYTWLAGMGPWAEALWVALADTWVARVDKKTWVGITAGPFTFTCPIPETLLRLRRNSSYTDHLISFSLTPPLLKPYPETALYRRPFRLSSQQAPFHR